ncbi:MAG: four helix bundle protein [Patescibacteria group bacterium]
MTTSNNTSQKKEYKQTSFRDLVVWQQAFEFAKGVHELVHALPQEERYALAAQLNRAALSMSAQIAQGQQKRVKDEFVKHLNYARNNTAVCETSLMLISDLFPEHKETVNRLKETNTVIYKMLSALIYTIENPKKKSEKNEAPATTEPVRVAVAA